MHVKKLMKPALIGVTVLVMILVSGCAATDSGPQLTFNDKPIIVYQGDEYVNVGEMRQGAVMQLYGDINADHGYWMQDDDTGRMYPVVRSDSGEWVMPLSSLGQRDLDRRAEKDKPTPGSGYIDDMGGEGGGEGGGGD